MGICTAMLGAGTVLAATPALAGGEYVCLKAVGTTAYYPNGQPIVTASAWEPDGVTSDPSTCPAGDISVGG